MGRRTELKERLKLSLRRRPASEIQQEASDGQEDLWRAYFKHAETAKLCEQCREIDLQLFIRSSEPPGARGIPFKLSVPMFYVGLGSPELDEISIRFLRLCPLCAFVLYRSLNYLSPGDPGFRAWGAYGLQRDGAFLSPSWCSSTGSISRSPDARNQKPSTLIGLEISNIEKRNRLTDLMDGEKHIALAAKHGTFLIRLASRTVVLPISSRHHTVV